MFTTQPDQCYEGGKVAHHSSFRHSLLDVGQRIRPCLACRECDPRVVLKGL